MDRREFLKRAAIAAPAMMFAGSNIIYADDDPIRVAITMDDPHLWQRPLLSPMDRNDAILSALEAHDNLKAGLFVCGSKVDTPLGGKLLKLWGNRGHWICNHSYSHLNFNSEDITFKIYAADFDKCHDLISAKIGFHAKYRYPYLKEGDTRKKRNAMREHLTKYGYGIGCVTIDTSDWYVDQRLCEKLKAAPDIDTTTYRDYYLAHMLDRVHFYDNLARNTLGRSPKHTILVHHSLLNALFLGDLIDYLEENGVVFVDVDEAFSDPVFEELPDIVPAGESLIWALAHEKGAELRYPSESEVYEAKKMDDLGL